MISEYLNKGQDNAIPGRDLAGLLNIDIRTVTEQIEKERRAGIPICAVPRGRSRGYFLPASPEDIEDYCERLKHRATELFVTRQALIRTLRKIQTEKEGDNNGTE